MQLCSDNNIQWVEDPTIYNAPPSYNCSKIRLELQKRPDIHEGVMDIIGTFGKARKKINQERNAVYYNTANSKL